MIKAGVLAVQLLPRSAVRGGYCIAVVCQLIVGPLTGIMLFTDGVCGFTSTGAMHTTVAQLRSSSISCWAVLVGGRPEPHTGFGLIPDTETLMFLTRASNGCVIDPNKASHSGH